MFLINHLSSTAEYAAGILICIVVEIYSALNFRLIAVICALIC